MKVRIALEMLMCDVLQQISRCMKKESLFSHQTCPLRWIIVNWLKRLTMKQHPISFLLLLFGVLWFSCQNGSSDTSSKKNDIQSPIDTIPTDLCEAVLHLLTLERVRNFSHLTTPAVSSIKIFHSKHTKCSVNEIHSNPLSFVQSDFSPDQVMAWRDTIATQLPKEVAQLFVIEHSYNPGDSKWTLKIFIKNSGALIRLFYDKEGVYNIEKDLTLGYI